MAGVSKDYYAGHQRGLAEGEARAEARIIKVLFSEAGYHEMRQIYWGKDKADLIALIKGKAE